jgi:hypothetical protein
MADRISKLRDFIRNYFTSEHTFNNSTRPSAKDTTRKAKSACQLCRSTPSERFVWAMVILIIALIGLVAIEVCFIVVTGTANVEILVVISGLVGAISSRFLEAKNR